MLLAIVTVLATIVLTGILLGRPRVTVPAAVAARVHAGFEKLRRQHSGQTGDYVAWATVGFALLGALIALATRGTP